MPTLKSAVLFLASPRVAALLSLLAFALIGFGEEDIVSLPFLLFISMTLLSFSLLITQRVAASLCFSLGFLLTISAISHMKLEFMGMNIYAHDVIFYQRDLEVYRFLWDSYLDPVWPALGILVVAAGLFAMAWRWEPRSQYPKATAAIVATLALPGILLSYPAGAGKPAYYFAGHRATSFFASLWSASEITSEMKLYGGLSIDRSVAGYRADVDCGLSSSRPDIVIVLMESAVQPSAFKFKVGPDLRQAFASEENIRGLRVETFGGGTWISTVGLMTSLSTTDFGWARPYLPVYLQGRVHHSLPAHLKKCGYKSAAISPLTRDFVNEGPFMASIGIEDYLDAHSIRAPSKHERDSFYFDAAADYIKVHRSADNRPLLLFVMTMAPHGPYRTRFLPELKLPGEPFGNGLEEDEYLRRLSFQQNDLADFLTKLKGVTPAKGTIILEFGDHQPKLPHSAITGPDGLGNLNSKAYQTYYRVRSVDAKLTGQLPEFAALDIAYVAPTLLEAAGLPLDDVYSELVALRDHCRGALALCPDRERVRAHISRLVNGKLLDLRTDAPVIAQ